MGKSLPDVRLEEIWTCIDYHAKFSGAFSRTWGGDVVPELKSALLRLYGGPCDELAKNLTLSNEYTLGRIINQMKSGDTLISFNYDTLVERLFMKRQNARLDLRHCSGPPPDGVVRLAKPHGSASWCLHNLGHNLTDGRPAIESLDQAEAKARNVVPLVLGAVPIKSELLLEVQCYYHVHRVFEVIRHQWRAVADAVRDANRLVVLGYSFPKEDGYGRFFFREAMRERPKDRALRVEYYQKRGRAKDTKDSIREAFGDHLDIKRSLGPVTRAPLS